MHSKSFAVTGAASGIGRATVLALARRGANVAALDIDEQGALSVAEEAMRCGAPQGIGIACDVSSAESVESAFARLDDELTTLNGVFANAGVELSAPLESMPYSQWSRVLEVNLTGVFLTCRETIRRLLQRGQSGSVVCTSSPAAFVGFSGGGNSAYAASKGGISAFVRSAAIDYAHAGIRVNAVVPGATETPMLLTGALQKSQPEELQHIRKAATSQIPLGRLAQPSEVAACVLWLLSDESSYVTGTNMVCDGGLMAKSANTI